MLSSWDSSLSECQRIEGKNVVEQLIALPPSPYPSLLSAHLASPSIHRHFTQYLLISYWGRPFLWAWPPAALLSLPQASLASPFITTLSLVMTRKETLLMLQNPLIGYVKTSVMMTAERHALRWCILMSAIIKESDAAAWYCSHFPSQNLFSLLLIWWIIGSYIYWTPSVYLEVYTIPCTPGIMSPLLHSKKAIE